MTTTIKNVLFVSILIFVLSFTFSPLTQAAKQYAQSVTGSGATDRTTFDLSISESDHGLKVKIAAEAIDPAADVQKIQLNSHQATYYYGYAVIAEGEGNVWYQNGEVKKAFLTVLALDNEASGGAYGSDMFAVQACTDETLSSCNIVWNYAWVVSGDIVYSAY